MGGLIVITSSITGLSVWRLHFWPGLLCRGRKDSLPPKAREVDASVFRAGVVEKKESARTWRGLLNPSQCLSSQISNSPIYFYPVFRPMNANRLGLNLLF